MLRLYEQWYAFYKLYKLDAHVMKESLNSYGQQFYQYQQSEKPPLTSNNWIQKIPWHVTLEFHVLELDR